VSTPLEANGPRFPPRVGNALSSFRLFVPAPVPNVGYTPVGGVAMEQSQKSVISEAAAAMGRVRSPAKTAAARANSRLGGRRRGTKLTDAHRAAIVAGLARRRAVGTSLVSIEEDGPGTDG
jgi:hypothetical protein